MSAATARYWLTSPPGARNSIRMPWPCPTTRTAQVRLSIPHAIEVGAKLPSTNRL